MVLINLVLFCVVYTFLILCLRVISLGNLFVHGYFGSPLCVLTTPLLGVSLRVRRCFAVPVCASILRVFCAFFATLSFLCMLQIMHTRNKTDGFYLQNFTIMIMTVIRVH